MAKETVVQIKERIADRFDVLEILTQECLNGNTRSLIVSMTQICNYKNQKKRTPEIRFPCS